MGGDGRYHERSVAVSNHSQSRRGLYCVVAKEAHAVATLDHEQTVWVRLLDV